MGKSKVVVAALTGGLALGVISRLWMRWISTDPEFSWSGTIFIVIAFMIFTTNQSIVFFYVRNLPESEVRYLCELSE